MKIGLWILRIVLAFYNLAGGLYMMGHYRNLGNIWALRDLPMLFWLLLGLIQVVFTIGLVVPRKQSERNWTQISALGLAVISLLGIVLYISYSGFPGMLWGLIPAVLLVFVASKQTEKK